MARPLRIEYPNAWYHVMNRGAGGRCVFPDDVLRQMFLQLLCDIHEMFDVCCHAYCLMGNHYHLLTQTRQPNLGRAMRHLDGVYTQRHNRRLDTDGPLFRGRYKSQLIERDTYLLYTSRYIHRNPLAAGLCKRLINYPWSSYPFYAGARPVPSWLYLRETLAPFASARAYCAFVDANEDDGHSDKFAESLAGDDAPPILGSQDFVDAIRRSCPDEPDYEIPQAKVRLPAMTLFGIIDTVSEFTGVSRRDMIAANNSRGRTVRDMAMLLCRQYAGFTLREIGAVFGIERYTTVASAISRFRVKATRDVRLARELADLANRFR